MSKSLVKIVYVKRVQVGTIVSSTICTDICTVLTLGIVGDKLVRGFGISETGGVVFGRAYSMDDIVEVQFL